MKSFEHARTIQKRKEEREKSMISTRCNIKKTELLRCKIN